MDYKENNCDKICRCSLDRIIDGDTIDVCIDLGFDVMTRKRCRLLELTHLKAGHQTKKKKHGLQSKQKLKELS